VQLYGTKGSSWSPSRLCGHVDREDGEAVDVAPVVAAMVVRPEAAELVGDQHGLRVNRVHRDRLDPAPVERKAERGRHRRRQKLTEGRHGVPFDSWPQCHVVRR
jgi:hypothetical protein